MKDVTYVVIATDWDNEGNRFRNLVKQFASKEDALNFAKECTFYHGYLEDLYGAIEELPSGTELVDQNLGLYSNWPVYLVQKLTTESVCLDYLMDYYIARGGDPSEIIRREKV